MRFNVSCGDAVNVLTVAEQIMRTDTYLFLFKANELWKTTFSPKRFYFRFPFIWKILKKNKVRVITFRKEQLRKTRFLFK